VNSRLIAIEHRKGVANCIDKYADNCIDARATAKLRSRLILNNSSEVLTYRHTRPRTVIKEEFECRNLLGLSD